MTRCDVQGTGAVELYFYDELPPAERARLELHLRSCAECARVLDELRVIRDALATRPDVCAPESGDWSAFMARVESAVAYAPRAAGLAGHRATRRGGYVAYLAMAAVLALVTVSVTVVWRSRHVQPVATTASSSSAVHSSTETDARADFEALSEEHFERSKLVVLGLATKDPADDRSVDWTYERELASSLLNDTRMYRLAAEDRGLTNIAGVMRDLEIVLLQTTMTDEKDPSALRQIQRFIQKRDLLEKMDAVAVPAADRGMKTKGI